MENNAVGALLAIGGFVVAFGVAKWVSTRIRLATSQKVVAAARMSDGRVRTRHVDVLVTLAACVEV